MRRLYYAAIAYAALGLLGGLGAVFGGDPQYLTDEILFGEDSCGFIVSGDRAALERLGEQIPLEFLVAKQTSRNAALYGFSDRGTLAPGLRADINVIDHERLTVAPPKAFHDLPAGGTRLIQPVQGYLATMVNGVVTRRHDADTGARPGRLVRS